MSIDNTKGISSQIEQSIISDATKVSLTKRVSQQKVAADLLQSRETIDKVTVGNGRTVLDMLDPQKTEEAQKEKIERLKKLVQSGQYQGPDSTVLAQAVAAELNVEILSGQFLKFNNE